MENSLSAYFGYNKKFNDYTNIFFEVLLFGGWENNPNVYKFGNS